MAINDIRRANGVRWRHLLTFHGSFKVYQLMMSTFYYIGIYLNQGFKSLTPSTLCNVHIIGYLILHDAVILLSTLLLMGLEYDLCSWELVHLICTFLIAVDAKIVNYKTGDHMLFQNKVMVCISNQVLMVVVTYILSFFNPVRNINSLEREQQVQEENVEMELLQPPPDDPPPDDPPPDDPPPDDFPSDDPPSDDPSGYILDSDEEREFEHRVLPLLVQMEEWLLQLVDIWIREAAERWIEEEMEREEREREEREREQREQRNREQRERRETERREREQRIRDRKKILEREAKKKEKKKNKGKMGNRGKREIKKQTERREGKGETKIEIRDKKKGSRDGKGERKMENRDKKKGNKEGKKK